MATSGYPFAFPGAYWTDKLDPNLCSSGLPKPLPKDELALPSKSTSISYQRAPTVSSEVSVKAILSSPNTPFAHQFFLYH